MEATTTAARGLKNACAIFLKDLQALPEEAFTKSFGPSVRTVADIVYEVNLVNDHVGMVLRGEEPFDWPDSGWIKAPEDFQTKETVMKGFEESSRRIVETASSFTPQDLERKVQTERGETTVAERCQFMTVHLWYHCGQLNFIQTLLGDDVWHWG